MSGPVDVKDLFSVPEREGMPARPVRDLVPIQGPSSAAPGRLLPHREQEKSGAVLRRFVLLVAVALLAPALSAHAAGNLNWDRVENVRATAVQIGEIQARQGVEKAFKFISDCYKTHGLARDYTKAFEGCIAADYMVSRALMEVYLRVPREVLQKSGAPSPEQIDQSFKNRAGNAFAQYQRPAEDALSLRSICEVEGMPLFLKAIFPESAGSQPDAPSSLNEKKQ